MDQTLERVVVAKVTRRLIPFMFVLYVTSYLDRINVGFAALQMNQALGFDSAVYGLGAGIFLHRLLSVRGAQQPDPGARRRALLDPAHHDLLGNHRRGDDVGDAAADVLP